MKFGNLSVKATLRQRGRYEVHRRIGPKTKRNHHEQNLVGHRPLLVEEDIRAQGQMLTNLIVGGG